MNEEVQGLLDELFRPEAHERWLRHPQNRFSGRSAQEMLDDGLVVPVVALLESLAGGVFA